MRVRCICAVQRWRGGLECEEQDMKQRTRIRRMKDHLYPWWIYADQQRKAWAQVRATARKMSDALREAYERARA
jgi:hypothetical protein